MITNETPAEMLDTAMRMTRTLGKLQWKEQGQAAENDAMSWLGCLDRSIEAVQSQNIVLAVENMQLANTIEKDWPTFKRVADDVIKVLESIQDERALEKYLKGV